MSTDQKAVLALAERVCTMAASAEVRPLLVAVDGRCAAGKSTLAASLAECLRRRTVRAQIVHMDDFFLRPEQRTPERFAIPGENIDHERFLEEVLLPLSKNQPVVYRPYDCSVQALGEEICLPCADVVIVEGSYSCHRALWDFYHLHVFLDVDPALQRERILARNGERMLARFVGEWIPMEETYHRAEQLRERCELVLTMVRERP
jgi:uridine kinase